MGYAMGCDMIDTRGDPWGTPCNHLPCGISDGKSRGTRHGIPHIINSARNISWYMPQIIHETFHETKNQHGRATLQGRFQ